MEDTHCHRGIDCSGRVVAAAVPFVVAVVPFVVAVPFVAVVVAAASVDAASDPGCEIVCEIETSIACLLCPHFSGYRSRHLFCYDWNYEAW
jgi:hypothetical protein